MANSRAPTPTWPDRPVAPATTITAYTSSTTSDSNDAPKLLHRMKRDRSILSIAVGTQYVYAGSQSGEVLVGSAAAAAAAAYMRAWR